MAKTSTLEERIAATLASDAIKAAAIATLISEAEAAAADADAAAKQAHEAALDPTVVVDTAKVGAVVASATLTRDHLRAALPRLQEQLKRTREREREYAEAGGLRGGQGRARRGGADARRTLSGPRRRAGRPHDQRYRGRQGSRSRQRGCTLW
jgi:hypothetical protein